MTKLLGSLCVFAAAGTVWLRRLRERQRRRQLLAALVSSLDRMETALRLTRAPLPRLLEQLAGEDGGAASDLFRRTSRALRAGEPPRQAWEGALAALPLAEEDKQPLLTLADALQGDEESACKGISLASEVLRQRLEKQEAQRGEEDKRATALCFSAAALLVILLI